MSCSKGVGPQVFISGVRDTLGVEVSQAQWHAMKELAREEVYESHYAELVDIYGGDVTAEELAAMATESASEQMGKSRQPEILVEGLANEFADRLGMEAENSTPQSRRELRRRLIRDSKQVGVTAGTARIVRFMARRGVGESLRLANDRITGGEVDFDVVE